MHMSPNYWFVSQVSPLIMHVRWKRQNPRPVGASREDLQAYWAKEREARLLHRKTYDEGRARIKALGIKVKDAFPISQEKKARAYAASISKKADVEMEVNRGSYLIF